MITQRELDIAQLEAQQKVEKLFEEWRKSYLGRRAEVDNGSGERNGWGETEDSESSETDDYESNGIGAEGAPVLPGAV